MRLGEKTDRKKIKLNLAILGMAQSIGNLYILLTFRFFGAIFIHLKII